VSDLGPISLVVVDHYGLSADWEDLVGATGVRMVVVDDLADRPHRCDVLIDPTIGRTVADRVPQLLDSATVQLLGPMYALLRPEFDDMVPRLRDGRVESLLVFLGGATSSELLEPLVETLELMGPECPRTTIVLGDAFVGGTLIHARADSMPGVTILDRTADMPGLLTMADLAIGATGGAQWERCAAGVPTLTVQTARNQAPDVAAFERLGATRHLGRLEEMTADTWLEALRWAMANSDAVAAMSAAAASLVADRATAWEAASELIVGSASTTPERLEGKGP
jgi:spore coat polysaccharide biosynthesis predicted glycosyltransferase SpsG